MLWRNWSTLSVSVFTRVVMSFPVLYAALVADLSHLQTLLPLVPHLYLDVQTQGPGPTCPLPHRNQVRLPKAQLRPCPLPLQIIEDSSVQQNKGPAALLLSSPAPCPKETSACIPHPCGLWVRWLLGCSSSACRMQPCELLNPRSPQVLLTMQALLYLLPSHRRSPWHCFTTTPFHSCLSCTHKLLWTCRQEWDGLHPNSRTISSVHATEFQDTIWM